MLECLALGATDRSLETNSFAILLLLHTDIVADVSLIMRCILRHGSRAGGMPSFASLTALSGTETLVTLAYGLGAGEHTHGLVLTSGLNFPSW